MIMLHITLGLFTYNAGPIYILRWAYHHITLGLYAYNAGPISLIFGLETVKNNYLKYS